MASIVISIASVVLPVPRSPKKPNESPASRCESRSSQNRRTARTNVGSIRVTGCRSNATPRYFFGICDASREVRARATRCARQRQGTAASSSSRSTNPLPSHSANGQAESRVRAGAMCGLCP
jgi:hypothetical protein